VPRVYSVLVLYPVNRVENEVLLVIMNFCLTVDDVGYEGYSSVPHFANLLDFFEQAGIRATFFVVPVDQEVPISRRPGYLELLERAIVEGHEIAQHGLEHDRFEFGIPPPMIMEMPHEGPARRRLAEHREAIEASLETVCIQTRLATGRRIIEEAVGSEILGFRAPCLAICDNLFYALEQEGYTYDSSRYLQEGGWEILNEREPPEFRPIHREDYERMQYPGRLLSFPLTTEYTWNLSWRKFEITFDLARHDFLACMQANIPFVTLSHVSPIQEGEGDSGFEFYRRLLAFAKEQAAANGRQLSVITLSELSREARRRELAPEQMEDCE
jgi:peptidoglycan/xylan/chitin deacetylase (PgdA/CDA1 family)